LELVLATQIKTKGEIMAEQQHHSQQSGSQHRCSKCNQTFNSAEEQRRHEQEHHKHEGNPSEQHKEHAAGQQSNR
jgi:hypothetical protein